MPGPLGGGFFDSHCTVSRRPIHTSFSMTMLELGGQ